MKVFRLVWVTRDGHRHVGAPRFLDEGKATRAARLLRRDEAVTSVRIVPIVLRPLVPLRLYRQP